MYKALQFHIHTGSEHTVNGVRPDIEFHFVHQNDDGGYGVIGIMCNPGDSDLAFWSELDTSLTSATAIDANSLFNSVDMTKYFTYDGSFTTPPCTEGVEWVVIADICTIPTTLLSKITGYSSMNGNYREVQALNDRIITADYWGYPSNDVAWANTNGGTVCSSGQQQSPVDLPALSQTWVRPALNPEFTPFTAKVKDTGHSLKWAIE